MSSLVVAEVGQNGSMSSSGPRAGGPSRRRSFTPAQKLELLTQYEDACTGKEGGAFLREQGLYSSQIAEWRKLRDAGALTGKKPGETIGKLSAEQVEIARLRRQLEVSEGRLERTEAALGIMEKLSAFFENAIKESPDEPKSRKK
ncbi:Transposase [Brevibacterium antiquum]|uniref:Transposase n=6 Tax=Brevibacterium TaxID=1696 RepID=A0A2H1L0E5_9MICO|nr:Transposase [Brevibacterium antiquum]SMY05476.1 Transposase [Brevibacterium antiquum CNRZ 918]